MCVFSLPSCRTRAARATPLIWLRLLADVYKSYKSPAYRVDTYQMTVSPAR